MFWVKSLCSLNFALICSVALAAQGVPAPISRQSADVIALWDEVSMLVRENESLENPLPEPYIARGDLWRTVGCHEDALSDYLKAVQLASANSPSPAEKSRLLARLQQALQSVVDTPVRTYSQESRELFRHGVELFARKKFALAVPFFIDAVRLSPTDPVYRAYLAVTLNLLGDQSAAKRQATSAANLLRRQRHSVREQRLSEFHERVSLIQGSQRVWLQSVIDSREGAREITAKAVAVAVSQFASAKN